jgi:hypothetical protein
MTYAKRYNLSQLLNICSNDDDDGNEASKKSKEEAKPVAQEKPKSEYSTDFLNNFVKHVKDKGLSEQEALDLLYRRCNNISPQILFEVNAALYPTLSTTHEPL